MFANLKVFHPSLNFHPPLPPTNLPHIQTTQCSKLSRRELTLLGKSSLLVLLTSTARAEESSPEPIRTDQQQLSDSTATCYDKTPSKRAFLDVSIDGEPVGRIVIGLYAEDIPAGAARFSSLVSGAAGISYRRKEFVKIMPGYVQHGGVRSYGVDAELAKRTGSNLAAETLVGEWERQYESCPGTKNLAGTVSLIVRDPAKPPPKLKLIARGGKLEIDQEEVGSDPMLRSSQSQLKTPDPHKTQSNCCLDMLRYSRDSRWVAADLLLLLCDFLPVIYSYFGGGFIQNNV